MTQLGQEVSGEGRVLLPEPFYTDPHFTLHLGDCLEVMRELPAESVDAVVTDPPYGLEFMGKEWDRISWDSGKATIGNEEWRQQQRTAPRKDGGWASMQESRVPGYNAANLPSTRMQTWHEAWAREAFRLLKPGGHLLAFGGTRTYHRLASAIEDAGFEIRDCLVWAYASGFPKSLDVGKAIDRAAGAEREDVLEDKPRVMDNLAYGTGLGVGMVERRPVTDAARQWNGWGTALKPAWEPIVMARKPLRGTVASNVLAYGTGALNIDGTRIATADEWSAGTYGGVFGNGQPVTNPNGSPLGRWPANVILTDPIFDGDVPGVVGGGANAGGGFGVRGASSHIYGGGNGFTPATGEAVGYGDTGGYSRFFQIPGDRSGASQGDANAGSSSERNESVRTDPGRTDVDPTPSSEDYPRFFLIPKAARSDREPLVRALPERDSMKWSGGSEKMQGIAGAYPDGTPRPPQHRQNAHPTVKPLELMRHLVRLVTPPGGLVLDPFLGSGTTAIAANQEGFRCLGIEKEREYCEIAVARLAGRALGMGL